MMSFEHLSFVPATRPITVAPGIVYRPVRSWHTGVYAGERLEIADGDRSGCLIDGPHGSKVTFPPKTYTHRIYWRTDEPEVSYVSAFLSYPHGMGSCDGYFWEAMIGSEVERYTSEEELEAAVVAYLATPQKSVEPEAGT